MPDHHTPQFLELQKQQTKVINADVGGFFRAWAAGTVAGGGPFAAIFLWQAIDWQSRESLALVLIPLRVAASVSLLGMLLIALPATALLRSNGAETIRTYCAIGLVGGAVLSCAVTAAFFVPISIEDVAWQPFAVIGGLGAFGGLAASFVWGRHRAKLREIADPASARQANPIHELLH